MLSLVVATVLGAEPPVYDHAADFRLGEAAAAVPMSPDTLLKSRVALRRLTERSDLIRPKADSPLGFLIQAWLQLDPDSAPGAFASLFDRVRGDALQAEETAEYVCATIRATDLLGAMLDLAPDRARELARTWPEPASDMGPAAGDQSRHFWDQARSFSLSQVAQIDLDRAVKQLEGAAYSVNSAARGLMVTELWEAGRKDEALALAGRVIRDYRETPIDTVVALDFNRFMAELFRLIGTRPFDNLYREAWTLAVQRGDGRQDARFVFEADDGTPVAFSTVEALALDQLALLHRQSEQGRLADELLQGTPALQARVRRVGGLEVIARRTNRHGTLYPECCEMNPHCPREPIDLSSLTHPPREWDTPIDKDTPLPMGRPGMDRKHSGS